MSVPQKYREIGDFHEYYSGVREAPYLTIFVGGNHEASNHLWELYYGGWVAPRIYYLGAANVVRIGSLRIAGLSGIWKGYNYNKPHHERLPYSQSDVKSVYHVRELDVRKFLQIRTQVDVGISHDWPRGIEWMGNWKVLFAKKDLFEADARAGTLGSSAAKYVMDRLRPPYWFAAHLHCKFAAVVNHGEGPEAPAQEERGQNPKLETPENLGGKANADEIDLELDDTTLLGIPLPARNKDEIDLDMDDDTSNSRAPQPAAPTRTPQILSHQAAAPLAISAALRAQLPASFAPPSTRSSHSSSSAPHPEAITNRNTRFLALDKCLPHRQFLQILEIDPLNPLSPSSATTEQPSKLSYDKEWLAITRVFANDLTLGAPTATVPPNKGQAHYAPLIAAEEQWVQENIVNPGLLTIPENFELTAPVHDPAEGVNSREQPHEYTNPQTEAFCTLLGIENKFHASEEEREERMRIGPKQEEGGAGGGGGGGGWGSGRGRGNGRGRGRGAPRGFDRGRGGGRGRGYR